MALRTDIVSVDHQAVHRRNPTVQPGDIVTDAINRAVRTAIGTIVGIGDAVDTDSFTLDDGGPLSDIEYEFDDDGSITGDVAIPLRGLESERLYPEDTNTDLLIRRVVGIVQGSGQKFQMSTSIDGLTLILRNSNAGAAGNVATLESGSSLTVTGMAEAIDGPLAVADLIEMEFLTSESHKLFIAWNGA